MPVNEALRKPPRGGHWRWAPLLTPCRGPDRLWSGYARSQNPVDRLSGLAFRFVAPWLRFPAVPGSGVAGEIAEVGSRVTRLHVGDRVTGHTYGFGKGDDHAAEGAFQTYAVLPAWIWPGPMLDAANRGGAVLVWGASTSVGYDAVQLARCAGYRVVATASPRNFDYVRSLGAGTVVDYRSKTAVQELITALDGGPLAGAFAIGKGSLVPSIAAAAQVPGAGRVASSLPGTRTRLALLGPRRRGVHVSEVWGSTLFDNEVGPAIYEGFLLAALATEHFQPAPRGVVAGEGLAAVPGRPGSAGPGCFRPQTRRPAPLSTRARTGPARRFTGLWTSATCPTGRFGRLSSLWRERSRRRPPVSRRRLHEVFERPWRVAGRTGSPLRSCP
jgi:NADPH:quinone reductase-like Zn-dependent oxidoreductase